MSSNESKAAELRQAALEYHEFPAPGKLAIAATKQMVNQRDLALAYSPGVAAACEAIVADPANAFRYTARGNLVAVITNGTAVLGLGDIGPLAAKPVMEGKAVLFKKFAGIDVFDIEINEKNADKLVEIIAALEPTFGGINLEDIKAPECFDVERKLRERHEDPGLPRRPARHRHHRRRGAAQRAQGGRQGHIDGQAGGQRRRRRGAGLPGSAGVAGAEAREHLGHRHGGGRLAGPHRTDGRRQGAVRAADEPRTLAEVMPGADVFLGLSAGGVLKPEMVAAMAPRPLIFALANPTPEILPEPGAPVRARRDHRHRAHRLPEPGQQRAVLPVHLPRRAGCAARPPSTTR